MRTVIILVSLCWMCVNHAFTQNWTHQQVGNFTNVSASPIAQFIIDPYNNKFWLNRGDILSVIENDGTVYNFDHFYMETFGTGEEMMFAITPNHVYYKVRLVGLKNFDALSPSNVYSNQNITYPTNDLDTVFFCDGSGKIYKHIPGGATENTYIDCGDYYARKNNITYLDGGIILYAESSVSGSVLNTDANYLQSPYNTFKFSRHTDTLYIAQEAGISYAYLADVLDTITPYNTNNMPSPNVLDIEFDMNDSLWGVFGDQNGDPFAIAMLSGSDWVNVYDTSNSPILFNDFLDIQFDTLNNLWVAEYQRLLTIENVNTPTWLGNLNLQELSFSIFPNPTEGSFEIRLPIGNEVDEVEVTDLSGRIIFQSTFQNHIELSEETGIYLVRLKKDGVVLAQRKLMVE